MTGKLTPKQETFALVFVLTGNASEAYRTAYNTKTDRAITVWNSACSLKKKPHVARRIEELRGDCAERIKYDRSLVMEKLVNIIENGTNLERIAAIKELNRMEGYASDRQKVEVSGGAAISHIHLEGLKLVNQEVRKLNKTKATVIEHQE